MVLEWRATHFPLHGIDGLASVMKTNINYAPLKWGFLINSYQTTRRHIPQPCTHHTAVTACNSEYTMLVVCNRGTEMLSIIRVLNIQPFSCIKMPPVCAPPSIVKIPPHCAPPSYIKMPPYCAPPSYMKMPPYCAPPSYNKMPPYCAPPSYNKMPPHCVPPSYMKMQPYCAAPSYNKMPPHCAPPSYMKMEPYCAPPNYNKMPPYCAPPSYNKMPPYFAPPSYNKMPPYFVPPSYIKMPSYCIAVSEDIKAKPKYSNWETSFFCHVLIHFTPHHFLFYHSDELPWFQRTFIKENFKLVKCFFFRINIFSHYFLHHLIHLSLFLFLLKDLEFGLPNTESQEPYHFNHYWFSSLGAQIGKFDTVLQVLCSTITEMQARNGGFEVSNSVY